MVRWAFIFTVLAGATKADLFVNEDFLTAEAGVYCAVEAIGQTEAPDTDNGQIDLLPDIPVFEWDTMRVPAKLGISFGIRTSVPDNGVIDGVTITLTHPPFLETGTTKQVYVTQLDGLSINAYSFDLPREVVAGEWTFTATIADEVLYRATFQVVPPDLMPNIAYACGGGLLS